MAAVLALYVRLEIPCRPSSCFYKRTEETLPSLMGLFDSRFDSTLENIRTGTVVLFGSRLDSTQKNKYLFSRTGWGHNQAH